MRWSSGSTDTRKKESLAEIMACGPADRSAKGGSLHVVHMNCAPASDSGASLTPTTLLPYCLILVKPRSFPQNRLTSAD